MRLDLKNHISPGTISVLRHFDGLVQDCSNSSALAMEFLQSCTKPWTYLSSIGIAIIKIRPSHDHLIIVIKMPIPGKMVYILKHGPWKFEIQPDISEAEMPAKFYRNQITEPILCSFLLQTLLGQHYF